MPFFPGDTSIPTPPLPDVTRPLDPYGVVPGSGRVRIVSEDGALDVTALLGQGNPVPQGGVGGFESVARPGHRPLTAWRGTPEFTYPLAIILDRYGEGPDGGSVEPECRALEQMGGLDAGDPKPPKVLITGSIPHDTLAASQNRWVVNGLEWGDVIRRPGDGSRVRQAVTVTLLLFVEDDPTERLGPRTDQPSYRMVAAKEGDTFRKVAAKSPPYGLGTSKLGGKLARLNDERDPDKPFPRPRDVRMPTDHTLALWKRDLAKGD